MSLHCHPTSAEELGKLASKYLVRKGIVAKTSELAAD